MIKIFKKILKYVNSINNKQLDLLKEITFTNIKEEYVSQLLQPQKKFLFDLLLDLKGTSFVEGIFIINSLFETSKIEGDVCEFGVAQGKTSKLIGYIIKNTKKKLYLYDSFQGLPKPTKKDILIDDIFNLKNINNYAGKMSHSETKVVNELEYIKFDKQKININKGYFNKANINNFNFPKSVSFAYVDFDFYQPTIDVLNILEKILVKDGVIIVDDYDFFSKGAKTAVDEWIDKDLFSFEKIKSEKASFAKIKKISD